MSWPTGSLPAEVTAMRDMIGASATWVAASGAQGQVHYPHISLDASPTLPAMCIIREDHDRQPYAAGSGGLPSGRLRLELYMNATIAVVEYTAQGIAADLAAATTGLSIRSVTTDLAGDVSDARQAAIDDATAQAFRMAIINVAYGLSI